MSARALISAFLPLLLATLGACSASDATEDAHDAGRDSTSFPGDDDTRPDGSVDARVTEDDASPAPPGSPCGYKNLGETKQIGADIEVCLPPVVCTPSETCPRGLGDCVNG